MVRPVLKRGSSHTCEGLKAFLNRSETPPPNLLRRVMTRPTFLQSSSQEMENFSPHPLNLRGRLGVSILYLNKKVSLHYYVPITPHWWWMSVHWSRPHFSFPDWYNAPWLVGVFLLPKPSPAHLWCCSSALSLTRHLSKSTHGRPTGNMSGARSWQPTGQ